MRRCSSRSDRRNKQKIPTKEARHEATGVVYPK